MDGLILFPSGGRIVRFTSAGSLCLDWIPCQCSPTQTLALQHTSSKAFACFLFGSWEYMRSKRPSPTSPTPSAHAFPIPHLFLGTFGCAPPPSTPNFVLFIRFFSWRPRCGYAQGWKGIQTRPSRSRDEPFERPPSAPGRGPSPVQLPQNTNWGLGLARG